MKKKMIITIIIVLLMAAAFAGYKAYMKKNDMQGMYFTAENLKEYDGISYFSYGQDGGDLGMHYEIFVVKTDGGKCHIEEADQPAHNFKLKVRRVNRTTAVTERLEAIAAEYSMDQWTELPQSEIYALDAPGTYIRMIYNGTEYSWNDQTEFPENGGEAVRKMVELLKEEIK